MKLFTAADRFWSKVQGGSVDECWEWTAGRLPRGYGRFRSEQRLVTAHRWSYEALIAEIPDGLELDHLCRNTSCVNPWHLEPVTGSENRSRTRKSHCGHGHEMTPENSKTKPSKNSRECRACAYARERERRLRTA